MIIKKNILKQIYIIYVRFTISIKDKELNSLIIVKIKE